MVERFLVLVCVVGCMAQLECPSCGRDLYKRHCKDVCPVHGVVYDCSDLF